MPVRDTSIDPRLLESARKEFMEKGFLKAELKTICDNAGVTTGAVYKRYKGIMMKISLFLSFLAISFFMQGKMDGKMDGKKCLYLGLGLVLSAF